MIDRINALNEESEVFGKSIEFLILMLNCARGTIGSLQIVGNDFMRSARNNSVFRGRYVVARICRDVSPIWRRDERSECRNRDLKLGSLVSLGAPPCHWCVLVDLITSICLLNFAISPVTQWFHCADCDIG